MYSDKERELGILEACRQHWRASTAAGRTHVQEDKPDVSIQFPGTPVRPALLPDAKRLSNYNLVH